MVRAEKLSALLSKVSHLCHKRTNREQAPPTFIDTATHVLARDLLQLSVSQSHCARCQKHTLHCEVLFSNAHGIWSPRQSTRCSDIQLRFQSNQQCGMLICYDWNSMEIFLICKANLSRQLYGKASVTDSFHPCIYLTRPTSVHLSTTSLGLQTGYYNADIAVGI